MSDNFVDTVDSRIEDVSIQGEAMWSSVVNRRDLTAKAIQVDHLIAIVELHDVTDAPYSLDILVAIIKPMQWAALSRITVRGSEIDGHSQSNLTTSKDVLQEGMLAFNLQASKTNVALFSFKHLEFALAFSQLGEVHREGV